MECNDSRSKIEILDSFKTSLLHELFQFFLRRVHTNGFGKVAVAGIVTGNDFSHKG